MAGPGVLGPIFICPGSHLSEESRGRRTDSRIDKLLFAGNDVYLSLGDVDLFGFPGDIMRNKVIAANVILSWRQSSFDIEFY